jgi:tetratricopeptide (TPR) repeat protein
MKRSARKIPRRLILIAALLIALVAGVWFARRPIVAAAKEWRANSLLTRAEEAADEKRARESIQLAMAAWQLGPKKIETLRRLVAHGREVGSPDLSAVTLVLFFHDDHEGADHADILKWTLDRGDPTFFDQLFPNLDETAKAGPQMRFLHARKLALQGRLLEAIEEARALDGDGDGELAAEVSLLLANLLPRLAGNPVAAQQAKERLVTLLGHDDDEIALRAWRSLAVLPPAMRDPGIDLDPEAWLADRSGVMAGDRVFARRVLVGRLAPEERVAAMKELTADLLEDAEAVSWVVRWFLETGNGPQLLELPEKSFLADTSLFSARLQVLLESAKFEEAEAWLDEAPEGFPESVSGSLRAVFARRAGRSSEALSAWRRVIERASSLQIYGDCLSALRIAEKFGETEAASDVAEVILNLPPSRLPASESLEFLEAHFSDRLDDWLNFWRGIARSRPGDVFAVEQVAFLELLKPEEVDSAIVLERTAQLLKRFPAAPRFRATHSLWLLSEGRDSEALGILREADINWNEVDSASRAVYVIALHRTGSVDEARALEAGIRWEGVGPIRRSILATFLQSWKKPRES